MKPATYVKIYPAFLLIILSVLWSCSTGEKGPIGLRLDLPEGKVVRNAVILDYDITTSALGTEMRTDVNMEADYTLTFGKKDADGITPIELQTDRLKMITDMGPMLGKLSYDSEVDSEDPEVEKFNYVMRHYLENSVRMKLNSQGSIVEMEGMDEIREEMRKSSEGMDQNNLSSLLGAELDHRFDVFLPKLPEHPVKVGDSWHTENSSELQDLPLIVSNTYTLLSRKKGRSIIKLESSISFDEENFSMENLGIPGGEEMNFQIVVNGTRQGKIEVNEKTGWTESSKIDQSIEVAMKMAGMNVPMLFEGTIQFSGL